MPGPPQKLNPARRNARPNGGIVRLPAEGRQGEPPVWPLGEPPSLSEQEIWTELWSTPQAVAWERLRWTRTVARYCRLAALAEAAEPDPKYLAEARQLEFQLGLTPKAMRLLLWEIAADEVAEVRETAGRASERMKAV